MNAMTPIPSRQALRPEWEMPWHERMKHARRWHFQRLTSERRRPPNYDELRALMASVCERTGRNLAPEYTNDQWMQAYRRVIRRNLWTKGRLP